MQVHGFLAVIPPAGMEALLHQVARQILYRPTEQEGHQKAGPVGIGSTGKDDARQRDQQRTASVDRADGPGKEAAVDEPVELNVFQCHLNQPARQGIQKKQQHKLTQGC